MLSKRGNVFLTIPKAGVLLIKNLSLDGGAKMNRRAENDAGWKAREIPKHTEVKGPSRARVVLVAIRRELDQSENTTQSWGRSLAWNKVTETPGS